MYNFYTYVKNLESTENNNNESILSNYRHIKRVSIDINNIRGT